MPFTDVTITHDFDLPDQAGALGMVGFAPVEAMRNGGKSVAAAAVWTPLDVNGGLSETVKATTDPGTTPTGVHYRIDVRITGQPARRYYTPVPHDRGSTIDLAELLAWAGGLGTAIGSGGPPITLTAVEGVITPDAEAGSTFLHTATTDVQLDPPTGGTDGREITVLVKADGGTRILSVAGVAGVVTIESGKWWTGTLRYVAADETWVLDDD